MPKPLIDLLWTGYANEMVSLWDVARGELPEGVVRQEDGSVVAVENGLPVLAYARDVVVRVSLTYPTEVPQGWHAGSIPVSLTLVDPTEASPSSSPQGIDLSLDETFPCSHNTQVWTFTSGIGGAEREEYWYKRDGTPMSENGQVLVDGRPFVDGVAHNGRATWNNLGRFVHPDLGIRLSDSESDIWIPCYREVFAGGDQTQTIYQHCRARYQSYTLWVDSFICRVLPWKGIGPHSPLVEPIPVDLVRASLKTKRAVLDELDVHIGRMRIEDA